LWAAAGVRPEQVWAEMSRREDMLGIAEKLPKPPKRPKSIEQSAARRPIVALEGRRLRKLS
jgi:phosphoribosyl-ATP pyrophosphohydrolase